MSEVVYINDSYMIKLSIDYFEKVLKIYNIPKKGRFPDYELLTKYIYTKIFSINIGHSYYSIIIQLYDNCTYKVIDLVIQKSVIHYLSDYIMDFIKPLYLKIPFYKYIYIGIDEIYSFVSNEIIIYTSDRRKYYSYAIDKYNNIILLTKKIVLTKFTDILLINKINPILAYLGHTSWFDYINRHFFDKYFVKNFFVKFCIELYDYYNSMMAFYEMGMIGYNEVLDSDYDSDSISYTSSDSESEISLFENIETTGVLSNKNYNNINYNYIFLYKTTLENEIIKISKNDAMEIIKEYKKYLGIYQLDYKTIYKV